MFWHNSKSKRKEINAENIITLCNYKPKWTASLFSVLSSYSSCLVEGQSPCAVPLQSVEQDTHSIQGCNKASVKVGKKVVVRGEPPPTATSTGIISDTPAGDPALLRAGNALPSCHPNIPELPQQAVCYWFHCRFHCQNGPIGASSLLGFVCHMHSANSTPRTKCTGAGLGGMTQLHWEGCSSFPCSLKPSSNSAQVQSVTALLWALNHRNPGKQQETSKDEDGSAWPGALVRFVPLDCQLTPQSNSSQMEAEPSGALHPVPQGRGAVLGSGTDHEDAVCSPVPAKMLQRQSNSVPLAPVGWSIPGGRGCKCEIAMDLRHRHAAKSTQVGVHNTSFHFNGIWHQIAVKPVGGDCFSLKKFIRL